MSERVRVSERGRERKRKRGKECVRKRERERERERELLVNPLTDSSLVPLELRKMHQSANFLYDFTVKPRHPTFS